jgi:superfamily II DNA or RNA helicase
VLVATRIETGSFVEVRGERWRLTGAQHFDACTVLSLEGCDRSNALERLRVIDPFDRPRPIATAALTCRPRRVVVRRALAAIHAARPAGRLWTAAGSRIDLHAYQFEPALAAIGGATRLLIADAVGLGKTIEAGLLLSELHQRGWIERALIVCPAGLREIWQRELRDRFGIAATIIDQQAIADRVAAFPPGVNPWLADEVVIASIDFVKRAEVVAALDAVPIDLLIADEAHHLSPGTDRGECVARLAARAVWCVLVSATPHSGDRAALDYLTAIGRHADDIVLFKRTRQDVGIEHARKQLFLPVAAAPDEEVVFAAADRYAKAIWSARGQVDHAARLVAITIARRATSSIDALTRTLRRRRTLLGTTPVPSPQPLLPWDDIDEADGDAIDRFVAARGFEDVDDERGALDSLIALASRCTARSKMTRLLRLLHRIHEPAVVFTEYRDTLDAVVARLQSTHRVMSIHGAMARDARCAVVDAFNAGGCDLLVATDAAGEGLNLHHRCRLVIDLELPWNPRRLEQRVGRVDRIGQRRVVHAIRLFHRGTIEQNVLERLALRRRRARDDLDGASGEHEVAAAIFNGTPLVESECPPLHSSSVASAVS